MDSPATALAATDTAPPLLLANTYHDGIDLACYWVSEKYDGIRGYWNGHQLLSRAGNVIHAPAWFLERFPPIALDGELWLGPGQFEATAAIVRDHSPNDAGWRRVQFLVFDMPAQDMVFEERRSALRALLAQLDIPWLKPVVHHKLADAAALQTLLRQVISAGGEGLMLQRGDAPYRAGRSDDLLKLKPTMDADAQVVGYLPGKGKYAGMLGALIVERSDGLRFSLGSGLSDTQRRNPPPLGTRITYSFEGVTARGVPRFARLLRIRDEP
ncbi:MAG: DNA ligase [Gammaproteobacteria bacterium]|nr:DNA ligase [Gammaproteobacteria bacterium]